MAFRELQDSLKLPRGASPRFRLHEALGRQLTGELYEDLDWSFDQDSAPGKRYIQLKERRPDTDLPFAWEVTQDTFAGLFGDEQFPSIKVVSKQGEEDAKAESALDDLARDLHLEGVMQEIYEDGVIGSVAVVIHKADDCALPIYDVLPGKWCEEVFVSRNQANPSGLMVTYPISPEAAAKKGANLDDDENKGEDTFWYRYLIDSYSITEYVPLPDRTYIDLGTKDKYGDIISFKQHSVEPHGWKGVCPFFVIKNFGGKRRDQDGMCLWWPARNLLIAADYALSQAGRGLRYTADPRLFIRLGELDYTGNNELTVGPGGSSSALGGTSTHDDDKGRPVSGPTNVLVGQGQYADAKVLEINAQGLKEQREFVQDVREYIMEILGGSKMRAEHLKGVDSGPAVDKSGKPLQRLIRRQRYPYGDYGYLKLISLTLYGISIGLLNIPGFEIGDIPDGAKRLLEWASDNVLQGKELLDHVTGLQLACGGSLQNPKELVSDDAAGAKLASDIGLHGPYQDIKGSGEVTPPPIDPNKPSTPPGSGANASSSSKG